ncbi:MAG: folate-binding protein, partial [Cyanobacteria bacterium J06641_5]
MSTDLRSLQADAGATFAPEATTPTSFGAEGDRVAWTAALQSAALYDGSAWGLLGIGGEDRLQFLHNQTTNDIKSLNPGQGARAAIVNSTARLLDLTTIYAMPEIAWASVSPGQAAALLAWFDRYIFPADRVELTDLGDEMSRFSLIGPDGAAILAGMGCKLALDGPL